MNESKYKIGDKINNWTIISELKYLHFSSTSQKAYDCRCVCGTIRTKTQTSLKSERSKSCGCLRDSIITPLRNTTHGMSKTRLYRIHKSMKRRCQLPTDSTYQNYGGRGITLCAEWQKFEPFRDWALSNGYQEDLTIDRKNGKGNYEPDNCRWATYQEQANNISSNRILTVFNEQKTLSEWSRDSRCPVSAKAIQSRLSRGLSDEEAVLRTPFYRPLK